MNKEDRNSFRKEMIGKLEEHWAKSHSPEDDLFYYHPSEDKIVLSHALFWVMTQNIRFPYSLRCSQASRYNDCRWRLWW